MWNAFEEIIVLTLKKDVERHVNFIRNFELVGIKDWTTIYGTDKNDEIIKNLYRGKLIKEFPKCFRCGKSSCKCENNFLIPSQIACFHSYLKMFDYCVNSDNQTFLFVEDDVQFEDYATQLATDALNVERLSSDTSFFSFRPTLLSLGQNYMNGVEKREYNGEFKFDTSRFPSNVTFAFNKAFARLALDEFSKYGFSHTSDIYIHEHLASKCEHLSLSPKISHDLSWSTGDMKSNIHPKRIRAEKGNLTVAERDESLRLWETHIQRLNTREEYDSYIDRYLNVGS